MTLRDLLLVLGAAPLLGVIAVRLAAELGFATAVPPPETLTTSLGLFAGVFLVYVALTLRAIVGATREILAREGAATRREARQGAAAVSDFAIHLDRGAELDLSASGQDELPETEPPADGDAAPVGALAPRREIFGEVSDLLTRIPSARPR